MDNYHTNIKSINQFIFIIPKCTKIKINKKVTSTHATTNSI